MSEGTKTESVSLAEIVKAHDAWLDSSNGGLNGGKAEQEAWDAYNELVNRSYDSQNL